MAQADAISTRHLYEQGSRCCQQYSELTMKSRTIAQHIMIAYAVGMGLLLSKVGEPNSAFYATLIFAGIILIVFGRVLAALNRHYSTAFESIRDDCLVKLEAVTLGEESKLLGPWQAHQKHR